MERSRRLQGDGGFTLTELLVVIVISSVIMSAITAALVVSFRTSDAASDRLSESHDSQRVANVLVPDVQRATDLSVAPGTHFLTDCGTGVASDLVQLRSGTWRVRYRFDAGILSRVVCDGAAAADSRTIATDVLSVEAARTGQRVELRITPQSGRPYVVSSGSRVNRSAGSVDTNAPPVVTDITPDCADWVCTFRAVASDPDGDGMTYVWTLGDGGTPPPTQSNPAITHTYTSSGLRQVTVTVHDGTGTSARYSESLRINRRPSEPMFTLSCFARTCTTSSVVATDPDEEAVTQVWSWGPGEADSSTGGPKTYVTAGAKTITVTATDPHLASTASKPKDVTLKVVEVRKTSGAQTIGSGSTRTRRVTLEWGGYETSQVRIFKCPGDAVPSCASNGQDLNTNLSPEPIDVSSSPQAQLVYTFRVCERVNSTTIRNCDSITVTFPFSAGTLP